MKFKCNQSGNTVEFFQEHEIAEMRKHAGYTEVPPEAPKPVAPTPSTSNSKKVAKNEISINGEQSNSGN
jgi:hypothetical protein